MIRVMTDSQFDLHIYIYLAIASISRATWDYEIVAFFMKCLMVMLSEVFLERFTKYKIRGPLGMVWTYGWLMYLGKPGMDLW